MQMVQVRPSNQGALSQLILTFGRVQMVQVADVHPGSKCWLEIISVNDRQLEDIDYQVFSGEQDLTLSSYCRDFQFTERSM